MPRRRRIQKASQQRTNKPRVTDSETLILERQSPFQRTISERNAKFFESEAEKDDGWADDLKVALKHYAE